METEKRVPEKTYGNSARLTIKHGRPQVFGKKQSDAILLCLIHQKQTCATSSSLLENHKRLHNPETNGYYATFATSCNIMRSSMLRSSF